MTTPQPPALSLYDEVHVPGATRVLRSIQVAAPIAGADWTQAVPPGVLWCPCAVSATLTTAAAAFNRLPILTLSDGTLIFARSGLASVIPATQVSPCSWMLGVAAFASPDVQGAISGAMPNLLLLGGHVIATVTRNLQAADQWSAITLCVVELRPPLYIDPDAVPDYS